MNAIASNYHTDAIESFRNYKKLAERAIEQVSDEEFARATFTVNTVPPSDMLLCP